MSSSLLAANTLAFLEGMGFDPFFRGFLSVLVGVVVLIGGTYAIVATDVGVRTGALIALSALFGWNFLMGIVWTIYGIGWRGDAPTWVLQEVNVDTPEVVDDGLVYAETEAAQSLAAGIENVNLADEITEDDPDLAQEEALALSREESDELQGWRYVVTSDPVRGEAQSSADEILLAEHVFESTSEFVPLEFGAYNYGGKPLLDPDIDADDPDKGAFVETFTDAPARILHKLDTMTLHLFHSEELMVIQVQGTVDQPTLPGQAPPVAVADPEKPVYNVVMVRDRGGPMPWLIGGLRFTPVMFTIANGIIFGLLLWSMQLRDKREAKVLAGQTA